MADFIRLGSVYYQAHDYEQFISDIISRVHNDDSGTDVEKNSSTGGLPIIDDILHVVNGAASRRRNTS